jgi:TetR/AcrR family transcriptional repressor of nem operon
MGASIAGVGETRERVFEAAARMLRTCSYLGFSFNDIAQEIGISKASLHHHFPSKEALGLELLAAAAQRFTEWRELAPKAPGAALDTFVAMYRNTLSAGQAVCPGGSFAAGWDCIGDELKSAVRKLRSDQIDWLSRVFKAQDTRRTPAEASALAAAMFAACQGALVSARVTGKAKDFDAAMSVVRTLAKASA